MVQRPPSESMVQVPLRVHSTWCMIQIHGSRGGGGLRFGEGEVLGGGISLDPRLQQALVKATRKGVKPDKRKTTCFLLR